MKTGMFVRRESRSVKIGALTLGGGAPILVQSMCNTDTCDREKTLAQVRRLEAAGCDIVRLAVPTPEAADTFRFLKEAGVKVPLVADIHFDYKIALRSVEMGADKIRINPGNIGDREKVRAVADACKEKGLPIRIGVNSGSLEKSILQKYGAPTAEALAESALYHASLLEEVGFYDIVLSVKASDVPDMILANRILAEKTSYPLHLGVTEAGGIASGTVKSAIGIGSLLSDGIGDTIRVSLTADPVSEVTAAHDILSALRLSSRPKMNIVSCPTCGRTKIDLCDLLAVFEARVAEEGLSDLPITVALMGCVVNGPGEAREADIGIAGGIGEALLFKKGEIIGKYSSREIIDRLIHEIQKMRESL